ncbi:peptide/nickel transport system ATP-binding protein [Bacillus thermophilus]|uniref:Peptide/nickel transport system ATP-binding protein n=1 Tax=Siminovitchia thermophila TaxID=1245522 RepID=A0ABS2RC40_9BACI|nr:ABC transporter ATP-binding protein [Siminovitchia thermophila]MBM7716146.1 peptide/nickel transport system ATP-binding protein [Siminovitchia thermophila]ONK21499.1 peptide ABC transporter ATP-binding protein [Bacillus sp. VT-16-64]
MNRKLLEITNLKTFFFVDDRQIPAVNGVDLYINEGETLGIVGESGCGKSVTSLSVMRLLSHTPGKIVGGTIRFKGKNLLSLSENEMRQIRGNEMAMIFQEPMTSLNPVYKIGEQIGEAVKLHLKYDKKKTREHVINMLKQVGIPRAEEIIHEFPHQLSGGMRQRAMIAMAMSCNPTLLIADEPTTALDVTIQAQILELMKKLKKEKRTAIMLITHDLGIVAEMCDRVVVMYAGQVVEEADVIELFENPKHPYTKGLLNSIPTLGQKADRLESIPGNVPTPANMPKGCKFSPRCTKVMDVCKEQNPELLPISTRHRCRCFLYENVTAKEEKIIG